MTQTTNRRNRAVKFVHILQKLQSSKYMASLIISQLMTSHRIVRKLSYDSTDAQKL